MANAKIQELHDKYRLSLLEKAQELKKLWLDASIDDYKQVHVFLHKLAGSAGMYGFDDISSLAKKLKYDLKKSKSGNLLDKNMHQLINLLNEMSGQKFEHHSIDEEKIKEGYSHLASGVSVITIKDENDRYIGVTVSTLTSVSLSPPLVLWCLAEDTNELKSYLHADYYVVNVLSESNKKISDRFSDKNIFEKNDEITIVPVEHDIPSLQGNLATFQCSRVNIEKYGDHWVFIARVEAISLNDSRPLLYYNRAYRKLSE